MSKKINITSPLLDSNSTSDFQSTTSLISTDAEAVKYSKLRKLNQPKKSKLIPRYPQMYQNLVNENYQTKQTPLNVRQNQLDSIKEQNYSQMNLSSKNESKHDVSYITRTANKIVKEAIQMRQYKKPLDLQKNSKSKKNLKDQKKKRKRLQQIGNGEFYVGRIKSRAQVKPKVTFQDVDQIFRCQQCGKQYLSYMGIYRHMKNIHLKKDEFKMFKMKTFKDHKTDKIVKNIFIANSSQKTNQRFESQAYIQTIEPQQTQLIKKTKTKDVNLSEKQDSLVLNYDEIALINDQNELKQTPHRKYSKFINSGTNLEKDLEPMISLVKYQKLMQDYRNLLNKNLDCERQCIQKIQFLFQQNSKLYKIKEKYKVQIKFLEDSIKLLKIANKQTPYTPILQEDNNLTSQINQNFTSNSNKQNSLDQDKHYISELNENLNKTSLFQLSQRSQQSLQFPEFSTQGQNQNSSYSLPVFEVFSLSPNKKYGFSNLSKPSQNYMKGFKFDPQNDKQKSLQNGGGVSTDQFIVKEEYADDIGSNSNASTAKFNNHKDSYETQKALQLNKLNIYQK